MEHNPPVANGNTCYYRSMTSLKTLLNFFRPFVKQISNDGQKSTSNGHAASSARGEQRATKVIKKKLLMNFPSPLLTSAVVSIQPGNLCFCSREANSELFRDDETFSTQKSSRCELLLLYVHDPSYICRNLAFKYYVSSELQ